MPFQIADVFASYAADLDAMERGRTYYGKGGVEVDVRHIESEAGKAAKRKNAERMRNISGEIPEAILEQNSLELACALVAGWRARDDKGQPVPCTDENKRLVFAEPTLREFRDAVIGFALTNDNYRPLPTVAA